jgi:hypothetical protein
VDDAAVVEGANKTTLKLRTRPWRSSLVAMASAASPLRHAHLVRVWVSVRVRVRVRVMGACSGGVAALVSLATGEGGPSEFPRFGCCRRPG